LYREIVSNGRAVAACIRSLEKEKLDVHQQPQQLQPKSLDYSEYDSLDTNTTATSDDNCTATSSSKRDENVLKALERRYHLLYLRAIEIQCMFEGLLDRRNNLKATEDFQPLVDTSDEEPIAKIPKFDDSQFTSNGGGRDERKPESGVAKANEFDADSEGSEGEMECTAQSIDCVDSSKIVATIAASPPKTPSPNAKSTSNNTTLFEATTPSTVVVRRVRPKDFSKFNRSNRKSKNCAIFYYKHVDTDTDQQLNDNNGTHDDANDSPLVSSDDVSYEEVEEDDDDEEDDEVWEFTGAEKDSDCVAIKKTPQAEPQPQQRQQQLHSNASNTTKVSLIYCIYHSSALAYHSNCDFHCDKTSTTQFHYSFSLSFAIVDHSRLAA